MTQSALIQGGAGGLGRALVNRILQSNQFNHVFVTAREIRKIDSNDPRVIPIELDLLSDQSISDAAAVIASYTDKLHLVVTTAGILQNESLGLKPEKKLADLTRSNLETVFAVNCFGPFLWYAALGRLIRHRDPITVATLSARVASIGDNRLGGWHSYRASKTAQNMLTKNLSLELSRTNPYAIVVGLHPGTVDTGLSKPFQSGVDPNKLFTAEQSAGYLWDVLNELSPERTGQVIAWDGQTITP
jgi:NAD(P)-dependent dehydrogenase (short-subunit alcohol dehydrogenase family)